MVATYKVKAAFELNAGDYSPIYGDVMSRVNNTDVVGTCDVFFLNLWGKAFLDNWPKFSMCPVEVTPGTQGNYYAFELWQDFFRRLGQQMVDEGAMSADSMVWVKKIYGI